MGSRLLVGDPPVLGNHRWLRQLHGNRRSGRGRGELRRQLRASRKDQGDLRPRQRFPPEPEHRASPMTVIAQAFEAWGGYDQDDPFPLFAEGRQRGPVHRVTLADGHEAWLIARYDEARAALNDTRLSKDMLAAQAASAETVAEGLPGPAFARHMLVVDPPDHTRLRRLVSAAFSVRRIEALRPRVEAIVDDLL